MESDIRKYFALYCTRQGNPTPKATYTAFQIARGGVVDMEELCAALEQEPEKIRSLRGIGEKSLALAQTVCAAYRMEETEGKK